MICSSLGYTRQGYYKHKQMAEEEREREMKILEFVRQARLRQPRAGVRKLYHMLLQTQDPDLEIGRDRLFELLREHDLLVVSKKRFTRTSDSAPERPSFPNLLEDCKPDRINQAWVTDITYLNTCRGFVYLYLVSDLYSRKIIGFALAHSLKAENACQALNQALLTVKDASRIIHHSDHGSQYGSKAYQEILNRNHMQASMTGPDRCFDNAVAERIFGILKHEFALNMVFPDSREALAALLDAIYIYNHVRLHTAHGYKTPQSVYGAAA